AGAPDDAGHLQLVVQFGRLERPRQVLIGSDDRPVVALVIDRRLVPFGRNGLAALLGRGGDVLLEGDEVAQRRRVRERRQEADLLHPLLPLSALSLSSTGSRTGDTVDGRWDSTILATSSVWVLPLVASAAWGCGP